MMEGSDRIHRISRWQGYFLESYIEQIRLAKPEAGTTQEQHRGILIGGCDMRI